MNDFNNIINKGFCERNYLKICYNYEPDEDY